MLADPDGPVTVAEVALWPEGDNLVWELTVDVDHTFTVHTGTADGVVHNDVRSFPVSRTAMKNRLSASENF